MVALAARTSSFCSHARRVTPSRRRLDRSEPDRRDASSSTPARLPSSWRRRSRTYRWPAWLRTQSQAETMSTTQSPASTAKEMNTPRRMRRATHEG